MIPIKLKCDPITAVYEGLAAECEAEVRSYHKPSRRFRASEVSKCRRMIWYRLAGFIPAPVDPWLRLVGDSGNFHHDYSRQLMNHFGAGLTGFEVKDGKLTEDPYLVRTFEHAGRSFNISARADGSIRVQVPEVGEVSAAVEVKTLGFHDFDALNRAFATGGEEKVMSVLREKHVGYLWQANTTAMMLDLDYVYLLLVGRSGNNLGLRSGGFSKPGTWAPLAGTHRGGAVWRVEEEDKGNILTKLADIDLALEVGDPPTPEYVDGSRECGQCAFRWACHGKKKREKYPLEGVVS